MATVAQKRATLDDLYRIPEKAELIGGRIVYLMSTGRKPGRVGGRIYRIHVYRAGDPEHAVTYRRGETAEAEPAVAGWSVSVDWIFS